MKNVLEYKGYKARIEFDADDGCLIGQIAGIKDVIGFHGESVTDMRSAFIEAVDDYIETCRAIGKEPEKPYSGKVMFRFSPETHARAALKAALEGKSLNQWAEEVIAEAAG
jgi:predicted HicB family RNase H-like nuclease